MKVTTFHSTDQSFSITNSIALSQAIGLIKHYSTIPHSVIPHIRHAANLSAHDESIVQVQERQEGGYKDRYKRLAQLVHVLIVKWQDKQSSESDKSINPLG